MEWKKVKFMVDRVGEEFDALIISTTRFGFFVELAELFIEGLVPMETLPGDRYTYHENTRKMIGERSRRSIFDRRSRESSPRPRGCRRKETPVLGRRASVQGPLARRPRFPSAVNPEPLIGILANGRFEARMNPLRIFRRIASHFYFRFEIQHIPPLFLDQTA